MRCYHAIRAHNSVYEFPHLDQLNLALAKHNAGRHLKGKHTRLVPLAMRVVAPAHDQRYKASAVRSEILHAVSGGQAAVAVIAATYAVDAARDGIRVNSVSPGSVRTPLLEFAARELTPADGDPEATMQGFGDAHPVGRVGTTQEIAALVSYLTGPESAFHTGADFVIDGGLNIKLGV